MLKQFIKQIILNLIQLIEYFEYRNTNLDEKILNTILLNDIQIETDTGYKPASAIHITKPFEIYDLWLWNGDSNKYIIGNFNYNTIPNLSCADNHIVFDKDMNEVFVKDLKFGDYIQTKTGLKKVIAVKRRKCKVSMFDITVNDDNHRFYSNDILSHNTIISAIYIAHYVIFNPERNAFLIANIQKTSKEVMDKVKVIIENLPFFLKPGIIKNDVMEMKFDNNSRLITGTTTKRSAISFTIHLLYLDEFAHVASNIQNEFYTNIYPTVSSSQVSRVIITSTPNGFNLFYDLFSAAERGENEYNALKVDWWEVPGRDQKWYEETVANLGSEEAFNIQYGNSFITADGRLLSPNHIERLEKNRLNYVLREFDDLLDLNLDYEKYLEFRPDFDIERIKDKNNFFVFSIDIAEGGGGSSDFSVINIFEVSLISEEYINEINSPTSFQDFFGLKQVGLFYSNELSINDFAKIAYIIMFDLFYSENIKLILEVNTYGGEFIKSIQSVFPGKNEFDEEIIVKFKHKADTNIAKMGLKVRLDNKPIMAQKFKKYFHVGKVEITETKTVDEAISFGKDKGGSYKGLMGHDDLMMTCINIQEFLSTIDFADFVEELYESMEKEERQRIEKILEITESDGDSLQYDIYEILGGDYYGNNDEDDLDIF